MKRDRLFRHALLTTVAAGLLATTAVDAREEGMGFFTMHSGSNDGNTVCSSPEGRPIRSFDTTIPVVRGDSVSTRIQISRHGVDLYTGIRFESCPGCRATNVRKGRQQRPGTLETPMGFVELDLLVPQSENTGRAWLVLDYPFPAPPGRYRLSIIKNTRVDSAEPVASPDGRIAEHRLRLTGIHLDVFPDSLLAEDRERRRQRALTTVNRADRTLDLGLSSDFCNRTYPLLLPFATERATDPQFCTVRGVSFRLSQSGECGAVAQHPARTKPFTSTQCRNDQQGGTPSPECR